MTNAYMQHHNDGDDLVSAARRGDVAGVSALLRENGSPGCVIRRAMPDWTALMFAAYEGHVPVVQTLLAARDAAYIHARDAQGATALSCAARAGNADVVRALLVADPPADVLRCTCEGVTPLMIASDAGHLHVVRALLEAGGSEQICRQTHRGGTALMFAAEAGHVHVTRELVEAAPSEINRPTEAGITALMRAAGAGRVDVLRAGRLLESDVDAQDADGCTALMRAAISGGVRTVAALLNGPRLPNLDAALTRDKDITLDTYDEIMGAWRAHVVHLRSGFTALIIATCTGNAAVVRALLSAPGGLDLDAACCARQCTALHYAAHGGHAEIVQALLSCNQPLRIDAHDVHGCTPLHYAVYAGHYDVARTLWATHNGNATVQCVWYSESPPLEVPLVAHTHSAADCEC